MAHWRARPTSTPHLCTLPCQTTTHLPDAPAHPTYKRLPSAPDCLCPPMLQTLPSPQPCPSPTPAPAPVPASAPARSSHRIMRIPVECCAKLNTWPKSNPSSYALLSAKQRGWVHARCMFWILQCVWRWWCMCVCVCVWWCVGGGSACIIQTAAGKATGKVQAGITAGQMSKTKLQKQILEVVGIRVTAATTPGWYSLPPVATFILRAASAP